MRVQDQSRISGVSAEAKFKALAVSLGFTVKDATREENMFDHTDFHVSKGSFSASLDVKAEKKISRRDAEPQSNFLWVELTNVNGDFGWAYGKSEYIAFQTGEGFLLVLTKLLLEYVELKCDYEAYADYPEKALYKMYNRRGRQDVVTLISVQDLIKFNKENNKQGITKLIPNI